MGVKAPYPPSPTPLRVLMMTVGSVSDPPAKSAQNLAKHLGHLYP